MGLSEKPKMVSLKPTQIKVPEIRVTSSWEPELFAMFKDSVKAMGIVEPIVVIKDGEDHWLVDGLHRLEEAQLNNMSRVQAVVLPMTLKDVYLKNLMLNRLRGKTKTSEMARVVTHLEQEFKMDMDSIAKETGLKRDYVEKMLVVGRVRAEVLKDLDAERIGVGHAYEIGRIEDQDVQLRLLIQTRQYDLTVDALRDIVDETIKILQKRTETPNQPPGPTPLPPPTIKCHMCDIERDIKQVRGFNLCQWCFSIAYEAIQKAKAAMPPPPPETPSPT